MLKIRAILSSFIVSLVLAAVGAFAQDAAIQEGHGIVVANIDRSVKPGDDFYRFANGEWIKRTEIPPDRSGVDVWTKLTDAQITMEDGTTTTLTDPELDLFFALLVVAGNETTRNAISKGLMAFMEHRDQWDRWIAHPELADTMVEEVLRYTSPVNFFRRTATADTELGGQHITAGQKVVLWYPSANRDEAEFGPTADDFDIGRVENHHVAFGGGGPHFCLGANLARLEIKMMFEELARRMPDIELAGPPARLRMNLVDAVKHLPVTFTPSPAEN